MTAFLAGIVVGMAFISVFMVGKTIAHFTLEDDDDS